MAMSQIEQLLKYQQEDEKLIKLEQEAASSEERKNYVQAKNFMVKAPEKLEQIDNKAAELEAMASRLSRAYEELAEALKDFDALDEMVEEGADVAFYKKSALALQDKIKALKGEINSLTSSVKSVDEEYKALKKKPGHLGLCHLRLETLFYHYSIQLLHSIHGSEHRK